jgi:hypothetical protein
MPSCTVSICCFVLRVLRGKILDVKPTKRKERGLGVFAVLPVLLWSVQLYAQTGAATHHVPDLDGKDSAVELKPS